MLIISETHRDQTLEVEDFTVQQRGIFSCIFFKIRIQKSEISSVSYFFVAVFKSTSRLKLRDKEKNSLQGCNVRECSSIAACHMVELINLCAWPGRRETTGSHLGYEISRPAPDSLPLARLPQQSFKTFQHSNASRGASVQTEKPVGDILHTNHNLRPTYVPSQQPPYLSC